MFIVHFGQYLKMISNTYKNSMKYTCKLRLWENAHGSNFASGIKGIRNIYKRY